VAEDVEEFLKSNEDIFPENFTATVSHRDFSPDNIIYQGGELNGVIDFDFMIAGLDVRDLVKAANSFWMHDPDSWNVRDHFYKGYKEERMLPQNFEEYEKFFRIETLARLVASTIELGEMTEDEKEFYKQKLKEEI
jgi:Ser/Thr protein kinase RdoA (MazF antagonist)